MKHETFKNLKSLKSKNNSLPASDLLFVNFSVWPGVDPGKGGTCDLTLVDLWAESIQARSELTETKNLRHKWYIDVYCMVINGEMEMFVKKTHMFY